MSEGTIRLLSPACAVIGNVPLTEAETRALVMTALLGYESCGHIEAEAAEARGLDAAAALHLGIPAATAASLHGKLVAEFVRLALPLPQAARP